LVIAMQHRFVNTAVNATRVRRTGSAPLADAKALAKHIQSIAGLVATDGADSVVDATSTETSTAAGIFNTTPGGTYAQGGLGASIVMFPMMEALCREIEICMAFRYTEIALRRRSNCFRRRK
jgi:threonine dehydrogenase-like Zn-dependent dehydrogenase